MIDYEKLGEILMDWSMNNKDYYFSYVLFKQFGVVLPNKLLYNLPDKKILTLSESQEEYIPKEIKNNFLIKLFLEIKTAKYGKYGKKFGYKIIDDI